MGATRIFEEKWSVYTVDRKEVTIFMDLYQLPPPHDPSFPEGYKFSWIAFDPSQPENRVLFDCHPPKGPHLHVDSDTAGAPFDWKSLDQAIAFFYSKIRDRFGEIPDFKGAFK
jgi:hypothetical protein